MRIGKSNLFPLWATRIQPFEKFVWSHEINSLIPSIAGTVSLMTLPFRQRSSPLIVRPVTREELLWIWQVGSRYWLNMISSFSKSTAPWVKMTWRYMCSLILLLLSIIFIHTDCIFTLPLTNLFEVCNLCESLFQKFLNRMIQYFFFRNAYRDFKIPVVLEVYWYQLKIVKCIVEVFMKNKYI